MVRVSAQVYVKRHNRLVHLPYGRYVARILHQYTYIEKFEHIFFLLMLRYLKWYFWYVIMHPTGSLISVTIIVGNECKRLDTNNLLIDDQFE